MIYRTRTITLLRWLTHLKAGQRFVPKVIDELKDMTKHHKVEILEKWAKMLTEGQREEVIKEMHTRYEIEWAEEQKNDAKEWF